MSVTAEDLRAEPRRRNRVPDFTERDCQALSWIGEQFGARLDVLSVLLGRLGESGEPISKWGVRNQVERWKRQKLVSTEQALGDKWVTLTPKGRDRAGLPPNLSTWRVPVTRVRHCHAVNIVRLWYEGTEKAAASPWVSERLTYLERGNTFKWHVPDGVVKHPKAADTPGPAQYEAVEVELTHKGRNHYDTEVLGNLRAGLVGMWYFVPDDRSPAELASKEPPELGPFGRRLRADIEAVQARRGSNVRYIIRLLPEVPGVTYMSNR